MEHIPFSDFEQALKEISRVSKKYVVICVPYYAAYFEFIIRFPLIRTIFKRTCFDLCFNVPYFFRKIKYEGVHWWEIGRKGYSKKRVKKSIMKYFNIQKEFQPILDKYDYFFILEKKK